MKTKHKARCIVCLDVDGVLNHFAWFASFAYRIQQNVKDSRTFLSRHRHDICSWNVAHLNRLCHTLGAQVLLTSTWRKNISLGDFRELLRSKGGNIDLIGATTPHLTRPYEKEPGVLRGLEIEDWINSNVPRDSLDDLQLIILDDDSDFGRLLPWLIKTSLFGEGLTSAHVDSAIAMAMTEDNAGKLLKIQNPLWIE